MAVEQRESIAHQPHSSHGVIALDVRQIEAGAIIANLQPRLWSINVEPDVNRPR
jgi:hypothetical protein